LLANVNEFLGYLILQYNRVSSCGFGSDVVTAWDSYLYVEVYVASGTPSIVVFSEIEANTVADDVFHISLFNLIDLIVEAEVDIYRVIFVLTFNSECDSACETVVRVLGHIVLEQIRRVTLEAILGAHVLIQGHHLEVV